MKSILSKNYFLQSLVLAVLVALVGLPCANATESPASDFEYTITDETVQISAYLGEGGDVVIPETIEGYPVTSVSEGMFYNNKSLTGLTVPGGVTSIPEAFCENCTNLTSLVMSEGVTRIVNYAFSSCTSLKSVQVPSTLSSIGGASFNTCISLEEFDLHQGVTYISSQAFAYCSSLKSVTFCDKLNAIGSSSFRDCTRLRDVAIPASVTSIGSMAFANCTNIVAIPVDENNKTYVSVDGVLFSQNKAKELTKLVAYPAGKSGTMDIPESVINIEWGAFFGAAGLTAVTIPNTVTNIAGSTFYGCKGLTELVIPNSVTSIGKFAFYKSGLKQISFSKNITRMDICLLGECADLQEIMVDPENANYVSVNGVLYDKAMTTLKSYPGGKSDVYFEIPEGVTLIEPYAFAACSNISEVHFPNSLIELSEGSFQNCVNLTSVILPDNVETIGLWAFQGCGLVTVELGAKVFAVSNRAFSCATLKSISVSPDNRDFIGMNGVLMSGKRATLLTLVQYPPAKTDTEYRVPNTVYAVQYYAFEQATNLVSITFPASLEYMGDAFNGCTNLRGLYFCGDAPSWTSNTAELPDLTVYYIETRTGWSNPMWGWPAKVWQGEDPANTPKAPENVACDSRGYMHPESILITWDAVGNADTYELYRNTENSSAGAQLLEKGIRSIQFYDKTAQPHTVYYYWVKASNEAGISDFSLPAYGSRYSLSPVMINGSHTVLVGSTVTYSCYQAVYRAPGINSADLGEQGRWKIVDNALCTWEIVEGDASITKNGVLTIHTPGEVTLRVTMTQNGDTGSAEQVVLGANNPTSAAGFIWSVGENGEATVTGLEQKFEGDPILTDPVIPFAIEGHTVTAIDVAAFAAEPITSVSIPESVSFIGRGAFASCELLTNVTVPGSVAFLLENAIFKKCTRLETITFEEGVRVIDGGYITFIDPSFHFINYTSMFNECSNLKTVNFPETSLTSLESGVFWDCPALESIELPDSVLHLGEALFRNCTSLKSVKWPSTVASVSSYTFSGCTSLTEVPIDLEKILVIGYNAFSYCTNLAGELVIPKNVRIMYNSAFDGCSSLQCVDIQSSLYRFLNQDVFRGTGVTNIVLPDGIQYVSGFKECTSLTNVVLPPSCLEISTSAFNGCTNLQEIIIPEGTEQIYDVAFENSGLVRLTIPNTVTNIAWGAFHRCENLETVTLSDSVAFIGKYAFYQCWKLKNLKLPQAAFLAGRCFESTALEEVTIPGGTTFPYYTKEGGILEDGGTFAWCDNLKKVVIEEGVTTLPLGMFLDCTQLNSVTLPSTLTHVSTTVFSGCTSLKELVFSENLIEIGDNCFEHCTQLGKVYFKGNAPTAGKTIFGEEAQAVVYYVEGTTGWTNPWCGRPTSTWSPEPRPVVVPTDVVVKEGKVVGFTLNFAGTLQSSSDMVTWTNVPGAEGKRSFAVEVGTGSKFYRSLE